MEASFSEFVVIYDIQELCERCCDDGIDKNTARCDRVSRVIVLSVCDVGGPADVNDTDVFQARFEIAVGRSGRVTISIAITVTVEGEETGLG